VLVCEERSPGSAFLVAMGALVVDVFLMDILPSFVRPALDDVVVLPRGVFGIWRFLGPGLSTLEGPTADDAARIPWSAAA
jgi:hypothetical protein